MAHVHMLRFTRHYKDTSREIDNFIIILFQIYQKIELGLTKLCKSKMV